MVKVLRTIKGEKWCISITAVLPRLRDSGGREIRKDCKMQKYRQLYKQTALFLTQWGTYELALTAFERPPKEQVRKQNPSM